MGHELSLTTDEKRELLIRRGKQAAREKYAQDLALKLLQATNADPSTIKHVNTQIEKEQAILDFIGSELAALDNEESLLEK